MQKLRTKVLQKKSFFDDNCLGSWPERNDWFIIQVAYFPGSPSHMDLQYTFFHLFNINENTEASHRTQIKKDKQQK